MDGIGVTVKNVVFRKVKSGQFVVYSPLEFSEAVTIFVPSIHSVYLPENENVVAPEDISKARKIGQTLKIHKLERKLMRMAILTSIFSKLMIMMIFLTCSGMGARMKSPETMLKPVKVMLNVRNPREVTMKVKSGYVALYVINGTMKSVFMSNDLILLFY